MTKFDPNQNIVEFDYILITQTYTNADVKWEVGFFRKGRETIYQSFLNDPAKPKAIEDCYMRIGYKLTAESINQVHILKRPEND